MMIDVVRPLDLLEALAAVDALQETQAGAIDDICIGGIDADVGEIEGPDAQVAVGVDVGPFLAAVVGTVEAALLGFDEGVNATAVAGSYRDGRSSPGAGGQAVIFSLRLGKWDFLVEDANRAWSELLPGVAA